MDSSVIPRSQDPHEACKRGEIGRPERNANIKEPARAKQLYNEKVAQEKRDARAMEKIEREQLKAEKAKEIAERRAERERQR